MDRNFYFKELFRLQGELVKLQDWVAAPEAEGRRDLRRPRLRPARAASSSGSPSASTRASAASPRCRRRASASGRNGISSATSRTCRPAARSCCSTAAGTTAPASSASWGSAARTRCEEFFRTVPEFERMLVRSGIMLIKYWFSITDEEQQFRFLMRIHDPLKQWKLSPMDWSRASAGKRTPRPRRRCWSAPTFRKRPGGSSRPSTRSGRGSTASVTCCTRSPTRRWQRAPIVLPERTHHPDYQRQPIPREMYVPEVY